MNPCSRESPRVQRKEVPKGNKIHVYYSQTIILQTQRTTKIHEIHFLFKYVAKEYSVTISTRMITDAQEFILRMKELLPLKKKKKKRINLYFKIFLNVSNRKLLVSFFFK